MTILEFFILVLPIPLASLLFINNLHHGFILLILVFAILFDFSIQILGGLFQILYIFFNESTNSLSTQFSMLFSFMPILLNPLRKENILSNNLSDTQDDSKEPSNSKNFKLDTWLILNKPIKVYFNSAESKTLIYKENNKRSGIYLWFNNINGNYYIGSAKDLRNRIARYYSPKELIKANHLIHKAIIKHKHNNLSLYILEYCDIDNLIAREQFYLDNLRPPYNILTVAGNSLGFKHSDKTKELMREIKINDLDSIERIKELGSLNRGKQKSEEFRTLRSALTKGENNPMFGKTHCPESRAIMGEKKRGIPLSEAHKAKIRESLVKLGPRDTKCAKEVYLYSNNPIALSNKFRTYTEAAKFLGCHRKTIYRYIDSNKLYQDRWIISSKVIS